MGENSSQMKSSNKRIKFAHCAHPTRNGEAPLLAAYARRWTEDIGRSELKRLDSETWGNRPGMISEPRNRSLSADATLLDLHSQRGFDAVG